ncbi:pyridoxal-phosphate dependent enzyme, partial [bacterium]|nr:pyridoxal-phosphate dependent enzyme [bacterium]
RSTGPEIWEQTGGKIDYFVASVGTGGTISGTGKFLKEKNPDIKVIGADPVGSIIKEYFETKQMTEAKPYKVEGIGEDIIPGTLHFEYIDEVHQVTDKQSFNTARKISREEGIFIGGSSGTAAYVALQVARSLPKDKVVVVIFPDTGERYLSKFYSDEWMQENRFFDFETISLARALAEKSADLPPLISVSPEESIRVALEKMKEFNISQMPVLENGHSVGSIEEGDVMGRVIENNSLIDSPVRELMMESFPVVEHTESIENAKHYLSRKYPAVLAKRNDKLVGFVTKFDLLGFISSEGQGNEICN